MSHITQAHISAHLLHMVTQAHTPAHSYAPCCRSFQFFTELLPVTLHFPIMKYVFSYNTHTKYSSHRGTIIYCRPRGLTSFNSTCSWNNERCTVSWILQPISESMHKINPYILSDILTDKHNHTDLINWLLIQRYYMFWLSTSAIIK